MVILDTSILIDCLTGPKRSALTLHRLVEAGERFGLPSLVLYEWLRGPRTGDELADQEELFPAGAALPFGPVRLSIRTEVSRMTMLHREARRRPPAFRAARI